MASAPTAMPMRFAQVLRSSFLQTFQQINNRHICNQGFGRKARELGSKIRFRVELGAAIRLFVHEQ
jgi:hypothetical protein